MASPESNNQSTMFIALIQSLPKSQSLQHINNIITLQIQFEAMQREQEFLANLEMKKLRITAAMEREKQEFNADIAKDLMAARRRTGGSLKFTSGENFTWDHSGNGIADAVVGVGSSLVAGLAKIAGVSAAQKYLSGPTQKYLASPDSSPRSPDHGD